MGSQNLVLGAPSSAWRPETTATQPIKLKTALRGWHVFLPALLIVAYTAPMIMFMIPNCGDAITESYEPLKTLKWFHSKGRSFHKWGPVPGLIYAPAYAPMIGYWKVKGDLGKVTEEFPYGLARPHEQFGAMVVAARIINLAVCLTCLAFCAASLTILSGSRVATFFSLLFCVATSPSLVRFFAATKPDGLMLAFLAAWLAMYALVLHSGLTVRRGLLMSLFAVLSVSCKELTVNVFPIPYLGLGVAGLVAAQGKRGEIARFLTRYAVTIAGGIVFYALLNIVYAPSTWLERMRYWISGPGKDPNVWAPADSSSLTNLVESLRAVVYNFGVGGTIIVVAALVILIVFRVPHRLLITLPAAGFLALTLLVAGYMPDYFMAPLNITSCLPVAMGLAFAERRWLTDASRFLRLAIFSVMFVLSTANLIVGNLSWLRLYVTQPWITEQYCLQHVTKTESIHLGTLFDFKSGQLRLSYLGYHVLGCTLPSLFVGHPELPDVILIDRQYKIWIDEIATRPARGKMMSDELGYQIDKMPDVTELGYRLVDSIEPRFPACIEPFLFPRSVYRSPQDRGVLVYRREAR
jgi:hypothetical protein